MEAVLRVILWLMLLCSCITTSSSLPLSPLGDPVAAIKGVVSRILGDGYVDKFEYEVIPLANGYDVLELDGNGGKPVLRGNNGVSLASALNAYLKYEVNCSISWGREGTGDQLNLPDPLPTPTTKVRFVSPVKYRYVFWGLSPLIVSSHCVSHQILSECVYSVLLHGMVGL